MNSIRVDEPLLRISGLCKQFGSNVVLSGMDFELLPGEVHALLGENGAGKSTLINIITGILRPDGGDVVYRGESIQGSTPHEIRKAGITAVFQEFSLIPEMSVEENLFLGREITRNARLSRNVMRKRAIELMAQLGFELGPDRKIKELSRAEQQMIEIAKALLDDIRLLILDEPTASLTDVEAERLFSIVAQLKQRGVGVIYVSHRMAEIRRLADRITVLRDGKHIATVPRGEVADAGLIELMCGRPVDLLFPSIRHQPGECRLEVSNLSLADGSVSKAALTVHAGEVVGIAGLAGCGKSELLRAVFGLEPIDEGVVSVAGRAVPRPSPAAMLNLKVCYFTSNRVGEGLALNRPIRENMSMASLATPRMSRLGFLRRRFERQEGRMLANRLRLRPPDIETPVGRLSGGNRQKVLLARGFASDIDLFMFDEPTVGIDVGAKLEIYQLIRDVAESGAAVIIASSDMPEILHLTNRVYVMHRARVVAELRADELSEANILAQFFRSDDHAADATHGELVA